MRTLGASYIPIDRAHLYEWWLPVRPGRPWFYWTNRVNPFPDRLDLASVDPCVSPIVAWAHTMGLRTGPSCQGHFVSRDENTDWGRAADCELIRRGKLVLRNTETGEEIKPHIPGWQTVDPSVTHQALLDANGKGGIGIMLPGPEWHGNMLFVRTAARDENQVPVIWAQVLESLRMCLV